MWNGHSNDTEHRTRRSVVFFALLTSSPITLAQSSLEQDDLSTGPPLGPAIHATRLDYSEWDVPEAVTVISQEDIWRAGYLEISEIFRAVPGFRIAKIGDESRVSYHGTTVRQNRRMRITIDSHTILVADGQYIEFDRLPIQLEDIRRITITRGPNAAAFGENAFLASINFETLARDDPRGLSLRAGGGDNARRRVGLGINEQFGPYTVALSAGTERDGGYDYLDSERTPRQDGKTIDQARLAVSRDVGDSGHLQLDTSGYDSRHQTGFRPLRFTGQQRNNGRFVGLAYQHELDEATRIDWLISHNRQTESVRQHGCYTPDAIAGAMEFASDPAQLMGLLAPTLFVPSLLGVPLADTCFFTDIGIESSRSEIEVEYESGGGPWRYALGASAGLSEASSEQYLAGIDAQLHSYRAFGEIARSLGLVHASVGLMAQNASNVAKTQLAWRGALNWQFTPEQMIRYSYARSFRIPSLVETEADWAGAYYFGRRGDPLSSYTFSLPLPNLTIQRRLTPERIEAHALGYFGAFRNSALTLDVKAFTEHISNPVEAGVIHFTSPPFNSAPYTLRGAETEVALRAHDRWRISGHYSYLDTSARTAFERGLHARHAGSLALTYQPAPAHQLTAAYYGNSAISGLSYGRYDLVYAHSRAFKRWQWRSQLILHYYTREPQGIRDASAVLSDEAYFDHRAQLFAYLELTF
ncbi:MAG: TonB-dependent receptor [Pseudomonadota bacterium]|nr:TonB-dependent receptor [Pseudomonadota bacterium]